MSIVFYFTAFLYNKLSTSINYLMLSFYMNLKVLVKHYFNDKIMQQYNILSSRYYLLFAKRETRSNVTNNINSVLLYSVHAIWIWRAFLIWRHLPYKQNG